MTVPFGALYFAWCTFVAVVPLRRPYRLGLITFLCSIVPNELPFLCLSIVLVANLATAWDVDVGNRMDVVSVTLALLTIVGLLVLVQRSLRTRSRLEVALEDGLGPRWKAEIDPALAGGLRRHLPWARILFLPFWWLRVGVVRTADVPYGPDGVDNLLDVYRSRARPTQAPTLIYLHGGRFRWGSKRRGARPLLLRLAGQGWTCISANYHLSDTPGEGFPRHLVDVKELVAWVRAHAPEIGADPDAIFMAGSSAGAHLSAMVALTANDPSLQPGFESADTSITAAIGLGGYYGSLTDAHPISSTPLAHVGPQAPPFFVLHGDCDTLTSIDEARLLSERLRSVSSQPVVFASLPGGQHAFDLFHSIRFEAVVDAIEAFAAWVRTRQDDPRGPSGIQAERR